MKPYTSTTVLNYLQDIFDVAFTPMFRVSDQDPYGGLGISKLQFLIKKIEINFPAITFFKF
jgi:hypothetical protein